MSQSEDPIRYQSDLLLRIIKDKAGVELDYSLFSLFHLDKVLAQMFGKGMSRIPAEGMEDFKKALRFQIGCFYGECIRQAFSGIWEQDEQYGLCLKKVGGQEVTIFPLSTATERMSGDDSKLFAAASFVCREVIKQISLNVYLPEEAPNTGASERLTPPPLPK